MRFIRIINAWECVTRTYWFTRLLGEYGTQLVLVRQVDLLKFLQHLLPLLEWCLTPRLEGLLCYNNCIIDILLRPNWNLP